LRVLLTNHTLANRAGTQLYVRDVALALLARGHAPVAYSRRLGAVAQELRAATVPVVGDLENAAEPDLIHGQHHLETMTALLRFPDAPAVYFCHGWAPPEEAPPRFPRIRRYVAVDQTCRDRLVEECGIPAGSVRLLLNFVDLERFRPRTGLPSRPRRALVFSNQASEQNYLGAVREACALRGVELDTMGLHAGSVAARPEDVLAGYDLVFAKGRAALEAMAVGAAVIVSDVPGLGALVTRAEVDRLRELNFGLRAMTRPVSADSVGREIDRYDCRDAAAVSARVREVAGMGTFMDALLALYADVVAEAKAVPIDREAEARAAAAYLRWGPWTGHGYAWEEGFARDATADEERDHALAMAESARRAADVLGREALSLRAEVERSVRRADTLRQAMESMERTRAWRLRAWLGGHRRLAALYRTLSGRRL
jgi:hypothetical protein